MLGSGQVAPIPEIARSVSAISQKERALGSYAGITGDGRSWPRAEGIAPDSSSIMASGE